MHPAIVILSLLPGWCLVPPALPRRLRLPAILGVSLVVSTVVGLGLVAVARFDPWIAVAVEAPLVVVPLRRRRVVRPHLGVHAAALLATVAVAVVAITFAGEPFDADGDAGVYAISAAHLAATGRWTWPLDEVVPAGVPLEVATRTAPYAVRWTEVSPGFLVDGERVAPQFLPGYPLWGAFAAAGDGLSGPLVVNLLAVLVLLTATAELGRRLLGRRVAWGIPAAIAASPLLLVFVKLPTAETFLAGVLAAWLLACDVALRRVDRRAAWLAGALLATAITVKFFAWGVLVLIVGFCLFLGRPRRRLIIPLVAPPLAAAATSVPVAAPHLANHLRQLLALEAFTVAVAAGVAAVVLRVVARRFGRALATGVAASGALIFGWLAFVRPVPVETGSQNNLVELAAVLGPVLLAGAVGGWVVWVIERRRPWHVLPALVFGALTLFVATGSGDSPWFPFAARRALPVTLPVGVVMWASLAGRPRRLPRWAAGALVVLPVLPALWRQVEAVTVPPGSGFRATRDAIAESIPDDTVVLAFGAAQRYAPHLTLLGDRQVVSVDDQGRRQLRALRRLVADDRRILLLTDEWRDRHRVAEVWEERTDLAVTRSPPLAAAAPTRRRLLVVEPSGPERRLTPRLDVGRDDTLRVAGCYRPEAAGERAVRWTGHRAWILMPSGGGVRFVWSAAGHPDAPVRVEVLANGRPVGVTRVPTGWQTSPLFELPQGPAQHVIELRVPPYSPAELGTAPADHRRLGIRLDVVEVRDRVPG